MLIKIDIIKYTLYCDNWWFGKKAILIKNYRNISGYEILKGTEVYILEKMVKKRQNSIIHNGLFAVADVSDTIIYGIECTDLILK